MRPEDFPALYRSADLSSVAAQTLYLRLIRLQYGLLITASTLALWFGTSRDLYIGYAVAVTASSALLIYMSVKKPERDWYGCRALAESIKTSVWRYIMRAEPFEDSAQLKDVQHKFAVFLQEILDTNKHISDSITHSPSTGEQITRSMNTLRVLPLEARKELYCKDRIDEQREWYVAKVKTNRRQFNIWVTICVAVQATAILLTLLRIRYDSEWSLWPTAPLLVLASSIIGWIQIKKFNELASAYNLTAHEIGIIRTRIDNVSTEAEFSEFVNEAERAFSREHTQWVARQIS